MIRTLTAATIAVVALTTTASAETLTGCLGPGGHLSKLAVGSSPASPCGPKQTELSFQIGEGNAAPPSSTYVFAGFSTSTRVGNAKFLGMHQARQADFGPNARFCTTKEFLLSTVQGTPTAAAWVHPVDNFNPGAPDQNTCELWSTDNVHRRGYTVEIDGSITAFGVSVGGEGATCDVARPVTCCVPVQ